MTLSVNIGQIASAIEAGQRANDSIDRGPMVSPTVSANKDAFADRHLVSAPSDIFIAGVHNWADPTLKVSK